MAPNKASSIQTLSADDFKQAVLVRSDLEMGRGKMVAQACHASIEAYRRALKSSPSWVKIWESGCSKKAALKVSSEAELVELFQKAKDRGLPCALITDAGRTQVEPGTKTAAAIGPAPESDVDEITGRLKLL